MQDRQSHDLLYLFGGDRLWDASEWVTTDDRVRGGSSVSHLTVSSDSQTARFHGHLDTSTLGGAGFASQNTEGTRHWDLSGYDGLALLLENTNRALGTDVSTNAGGVNAGGSGSRVEDAGSDGSQVPAGKRFALTVKDDIPGRRGDGRMRSGVSWEADFTTGAGAATGNTTIVLLPWRQFEPTYRGRPKKDAKPLDLHDVKRIGLMMRSFFDEQHGDFEIVLRAIAAFKGHGASAQAAVVGTSEHIGDDEKEGEEDIQMEKKRAAAAEGRRHRHGRSHGSEGSWWRGVFCGLL